MKTKAAKVPELAKSTGHACFAALGSRGGYEILSDGEAAARSLELDSGVVEFHVNDEGWNFMRSPIGAPVSADDGGRGDRTYCVTGAWHVANACRKLGCKVPDATTRRLMEQQPQAACPQDVVANTEGGEEPKARPAAMKKEREIMKGTTSGKTIAQFWGDLFHANEQRAKDGQKPWTDDQLVEKMEKEFPSCAGKSTVTRPRMYRSCWNAGTYFYEKEGGHARAGGPKSRQYDSSGEAVEPGTRAKSANAKEKKALPDGQVRITDLKKAKGKGKSKGGKSKKVVRKVKKAQ